MHLEFPRVFAPTFDRARIPWFQVEPQLSSGSVNELTSKFFIVVMIGNVFR